MPTIFADMTVRTLTPAGYRFSSEAVQAVAVQGAMLADNLIDFGVNKLPRYREALENDLLMPNDIVVGVGSGSNREINAVGIYHPNLPFAEPVSLASSTLAFRALNLAEATSILAALLYRLDRRPPLAFNEVRRLPVEILTDKQVPKFLELLKIAHEMRTSMRKRDALLRGLLPATIQKFYQDNLKETVAVAANEEL